MDRKIEPHTGALVSGRCLQPEAGLEVLPAVALVFHEPPRYGLAVSLVAFPVFAWAFGQDGVRELMEKTFAVAAQGMGLEETVSAELLAGVSAVLKRSFGAILFLFLFASAWGGTSIGRRWRFMRAARQVMADRADAADNPEEFARLTVALSSLGVDEAGLAPSLPVYGVPRSFVWLLLASWAGILVSRFVPAGAFEAVAWNVAISVSICYGVQGLAVAGALLGRIGMAPAGRILGALFIVFVLVGGTVGLAAGALMALLGTLETWIPLRMIRQGE